MPSLEIAIPQTTQKSLMRKASQASLVWQREKAGFMRLALPKLSRAIRATDERLRELCAGVPVMLPGGAPLMREDKKPYLVKPDADIARLNASLCQLIELERSLLGFPSPGRRRDESAEIARVAGTAGRTTAPIVELGEQQAEQAGPAAAAEPSAAEPGPAAELEQPA